MSKERISLERELTETLKNTDIKKARSYLAKKFKVTLFSKLNNVDLQALIEDIKGNKHVEGIPGQSCK